MTGNRRYFINDHQNKAIEYMKALSRAGWRRSNRVEDSEFLLTDIDVLGRRTLIKRFSGKGKPVFLYPHTGRPVLQYNGLYPPDKGVTAMFTPAIGGVEVPHLYGFKGRPIHPVGWSMCPIRKFRSKRKPKKVLFGPIHVNGNGYLSERERRTNALVYRRLLAMVDAGLIKLTVRFLYTLEGNALWPHEGVKLVLGHPDQSTKEIEEADVMIGHQNFGYLGVASGTPTLMMAEHLVPISGSALGNTMSVKSWPLYKDYIKFPLDILENLRDIEDYEATYLLLERACASDEPIWLWRERMIGKPFDGKLFVKLLESYL